MMTTVSPRQHPAPPLHLPALSAHLSVHEVLCAPKVLTLAVGKITSIVWGGQEHVVIVSSRSDRERGVPELADQPSLWRKFRAKTLVRCGAEGGPDLSCRYLSFFLS
jgi:hypothetical protein